MKNNKSKAIVLSVLGVLSIMIVTIGITYAIFTYTKLGTTENTIQTGSIKMLYTENTGVGKGIKITNALPVPDSTGILYSTENYVFDFKVTGTNTGTDVIPYEVTLRQSDDSTLDGSIIKVYLTDMTENADTQIIAPTKYTLLPDTTIVDTGKYTEKTLYKDTIGNTSAKEYEKSFRLRMWISEDADFSGTTEENGTITYPYNDKTFTAFVNVYGNAQVSTISGN